MAQPMNKLTITASSKRPPPLVTLAFLLVLCILGYYTLHHPNSTSPFSTIQLHNTFLSSSSNYTISTYLRELTLHPHLAGTEPSLETINYVQSHFHRLNLHTHTVNYKTLLSYPLHASLQLHFTNGSVISLSLMEKGGFAEVVLPYHAYSPSGSVYEKVVFVNYGREEDYGALEELGVNVSGCVVMARRGRGVGRSGVVAVAESKGAVGMLLYVERDGGGVERGTVMRGIGDPLSPGWGGVEGGESLELEDSEVLKRFPKIPSLPLSLENALTILGSLEGGFIPQIWNDSSWVNGVRVGPGPTMVNLTYQVVCLFACLLAFIVGFILSHVL